ncbi:nucleotidyltransferase family protein [Paenarthrobacter ilicis]|uniref:nucleotidyltransferase family protein n=1 Tax=Paenarthrobacter ilicis TaxID=43665 RepID=UPI0028D7E23E|nr:nucleotidyltransferase family protein [Paenarthrobacter ilicis]
MDLPPSPTPESADEVLRLDESIQLSAALVSHIAEERNLRVLVIKGPAATLLGARPDRSSCDLDVLVDRSHMEELLNGLERGGWEARIHEVSEAFPDHSRTFLNPQWPSDIDVHWRFPGFYAGEASVFDQLWSCRKAVQLGGHRVWTLGRDDALLVTLLHALRSPTAGVLGDIAFCQRIMAQDPARHYRRSAGLGALGALGPVFTTFPETAGHDFPEPPLDWILRTQAQRPATLRLFHLMEIPWRQKPAALWQALFPSKESIAWHDLRLKDTTLWRQFPYRLLRMWRGLGDSLQILRELREIRSRRRH